MLAVKMLFDNNIIVELNRKELTHVNPLTVANRRGKKWLFIDLSRHIKPWTKAAKLRINSTVAFAQCIKRDDYIWTFDLNSAYYKISILSEY